MNKSPKQVSLEKLILSKLSGKPHQAAKIIFADPEVQALQDYANNVSIKRLGYNDHGPVHMRLAALNSIRMLELLHDSKIILNLEKEKCGSFEDSQVAVVTASLLHDIGMTVSRDKHEFMSISLALPIINRLLEQLYPDNISLRVIVRSLVVEGILGHMATQTIHSLEAGIVLVGDGCDMEKGRARIPLMISGKPQIGDIHRYSSTAIQKVVFSKGVERPVQINVVMNQSVGFFQVEQVLFPKIKNSPAKPYIELYAGIDGQKSLKYI